MVIQHNMPAMNSYRKLGDNNTSTAKNLEKLSSGLKINRAGDDVAGLAISEKMRGQIRGLDMATTNAQNGVALIQTAEGALNEIHSILQRARELSVQSANGTYHDDVDRENLDKEFNALKEEIDRIANSTHFNGTYLLNDSSSTGAASSQIPNPPPGTFELTGNIAGNYNITTDTVINGNVTINGQLTVNAGVTLYIMPDAELTVSLFGTGLMHGIACQNGGTIYNAGKLNLINNSGGDAQITNGNGGKLFNSSSGQIEATANPTSYGFTNYGYIKTLMVGISGMVLGDLHYVNWGTIGTLRNGIDNFANSNGFSAITDNHGVINSLSNRLTGVVNNYENTGTIGVISVNNGIIKSILNEDSDVILQIGANGTSDQRLAVNRFNLRCWNLGDEHTNLSSEDITTQENANHTIEVLDKSINQVSSVRAYFGAVQNRLEHAINNLGVTRENLQAAESTIRDVDMAKEMMDFTKNNILVQASQSMLAQSNQMPQGILQLLR